MYLIFECISHGDSKYSHESHKLSIFLYLSSVSDTCGANDFVCPVGLGFMCLHAHQKCDGLPLCPGDFDELDCGEYKFSLHQTSTICVCYQGTDGNLARLTHRTPPTHALAMGHCRRQPSQHGKVTIAGLPGLVLIA